MHIFEDELWLLSIAICRADDETKPDIVLMFGCGRARLSYSSRRAAANARSVLLFPM